MKRLSEIFDRFGGVNLLPVLAAVVAFVLIDAPSSWVTLTVAGLAMGMMIFLMASGLSLVFGLMDVLNFGHSAFISFGAFVAASVLAFFGAWLGGDSSFLALIALILSIAAAIAFGLLGGWFFETVIIKPVYKDHLRQILITMGALIVAEQIILAVWGGTPTSVPRPAFLEGSWIIGDVSIEVYRVFAFLLGLIVYVGLYIVLNRTRVGLLIRAGVENREMVECLGFRVDRIFVGVFMVGSALAAMGGAMWAGYQTLISPALGAEMLIIVFIVVIIGGLGSIEGTLLGAILVGLIGNYVGYLAPKLALTSNMVLMMLILLWRPNGLRPIVK
ncbi:MAG TPA: branched-chain amino acid ABC transporter permease [Arenicellales bacterium]|jgi:branched-chain amino acid transport system permease protein|nr:branched-chain amino acid ABC transporter permease [Acidiferrobacteraceae bacterium]MEE1539577.1 branched-chain amino acid ABC transporter permease [Arenicellales bacterium]HJL66195.1 branched-chain amino acid ABC transporter permease [Arenicellales bacterium]|tara:strand:- start:2183 stop:3175 length:993 start_codon:yes stop_codon:yes gene_type:complete